MSGITRINHIGLAVADLDAAIGLYEKALGLRPERRERLDQEGIETAIFKVGEVEIELMEPLSPDSPVGTFIARRGEGVHHVAYEVDDIAATIEQVASAGLELVGEAPRPGLDGTRVAFIHPKSLNGVLTELVEEE